MIGGFRAVALISFAAAFFAGTASAQAAAQAGSLPFTCTSNAGVPPLVRNQGLTELVSDAVLNCTGGTPTFSEASVPQFSVQIFLNTNVTSRLLADSSTLSEALLMIDEPSDSQQRPCTQGPCPISGQATSSNSSGINYATSPGIPNVFQGSQTGANSISWLGVPIDPPGQTGTRVIRFTNIRANANQLGVSSTLVPTQIVMFISVTGDGQIPINNPQQTVAYIQNGLTFSVFAGSGTSGAGVPVNLQQCVSVNGAQAADHTSTAAMTQTLNLSFAENFATAFKPRAITSNGLSTGTVLKQNSPGTSYNTESGFYNSAWSGNLAGAGLADSGTKLIARFNNVPNGVFLYVGINQNATSSDGSSARLIGTDVNGATGSLPNSAIAATTTAGGGVSLITLTNGSGVAVWEVETVNSQAIDTLRFSVFAAYAANTAAGLPGRGASTVNGTFAPLSTVSAASGGTIARFADTSTAAASFTITSCVAIQTTSLNPASTGVPYTFVLSASGGQPPYSWSILTGALPAGLTLASNGVISGIPTQDLAFVSVTFFVTDSLGVTDSRNLGISVSKPIPALVITTLTLPNGNVGTAYQALLNASSGQPPYRWSISQGALPAGLALSTSGLISGVPSAAGAFTFGAQVSDQANSLPSGRLLTITIDPALTPLAIVTASLPDTDLNIAYTASVSATGGKPPYSFSVVAGSLPPGIAMDASGSITGSAVTAGSFSPTIQVQDSTGNKASKGFSITVIAPLSITTESLPSGNIGIAYKAGVAAAGGKQPYKFSIGTGSLPAGVTMDDSGALSGKPTVAGTSRFTVQVSDSSRKSASKALTITTVDSLQIVNKPPLPEVVQNQSYSQTFTATGGTQPYSWSIAGGSLPAGLSLNSLTGELSGKPTAAGSGSFTIQVKDAQGVTASAQFAVDVLPVLAITTTQLPNGTVGAAYAVSVTSTGGTAPIQWSVAAGSLPSGLALSSTGAITGTPAVNGSFTFTIRAADSKTQQDSRSFTVVIGLPAIAPVAITGLADTVPPVTQPLLGLNLGTAFPVNLTGTVTLTFNPDSGFDDPAVQFTTGGRTAPFSLVAGDPNARFGLVPVGVQTGTVAGAITLTVKLLAGTVDVTPTPAPTRTLRVAKAAPVIRTVTVTRTAAGFDVAISGYVTGRDITTGMFHFTSASGVTVQTVDFTQQLSTVFNTWFQSTASQPFGSQFTLTQPFSVSGNSSGVISVGVTLNNAIGASNTVTANIP